MIQQQTSKIIKVCVRCTEPKPETAFHRNGPVRRDSTCKACRNEMRRIRGRNDRPRTPEERRRRRLWESYRITAEQYAAIFEAQGGSCAICRTEPEEGKPLVVDHCHVRGVVRALLCNLCNLQIGVYERTQQAAVEYLARYADGNPLLNQ
ncbi:endonuclease VII domain-containing protein [Streptomyces sp. NBC_00356]|uniref:endonuclease VII domain-containing protein n=1 Tax=Streptomyces sp. NBC_00356 TaxID=2975724 RepID=UPI002E259507